MRKMGRLNLLFLIITTMFFLFSTHHSYAHNLSVVKTGMHDYALRGSISSSELTRASDVSRKKGMYIYFFTPYWPRAMLVSGLGNDCPEDKEGAARVMNESLLKYVYLREGALFNHKNSYVSIDCRIIGGNKGVWRFNQKVDTPKNTGGKGCRVSTPVVMDFGTVQQGSKKIISSRFFIDCDKNSTLNFYFKSDTPGVLTMGDTIIKYGFGTYMSKKLEVRIDSGERILWDLVAQIVDTGSTFGYKNAPIILVVDIT